MVTDEPDAVRCMVMRGGTSKGLYFVADDLPAETAARDDLLLRLMGSPDPRQIDGLGGAHPLTSKVAVVSPSSRPDVDVDYLFLQVVVDRAVVTDQQNCGNILAGIGPFAVERGLVPVDEGSGSASVRILMVNTDRIATARFPLRPDGRPDYRGTTAIDGVPGTAAAITIEFADIAGGSCGALLPTGNSIDMVDGVDVTMIDNGMPVVVMRATDVGVTGTESPAELEADGALRERLERIRLAAGPLMRLGDVTDASVPKLALVSPPVAGGDINTRMFIPHRCHDAIGVLAAVSVATATLLPGSPAESVARSPAESVARSPAESVARSHGSGGLVVCEHPTGSFTATIDATIGADGTAVVERAGIVRTARTLIDGVAFARE
jgi:4-oxalomesaconate tautomerase